MTIPTHRFLCIGALLLLGASHLSGQGTGLSARPPVTGPVDKNTPAREKVLLLFGEEERHIDLVVALRERVERAGGRVRAVLGLTGIIADIPRGSEAALADEGSIQGAQKVYRGATAVTPESDAQTQTAIAVWNRMQAPVVATALRAAPPADWPPTDVIEPPDLPADPEQRQAIESAYAQNRRELLLGLPSTMQRAAGLGCSTNGAGYFDTSLYLAGDIAVGVFYLNGTSGGWTPSMTVQTFADIVAALDKFLDFQPNARLAFTYVTEVDGGGNPLPPPSNERDYVNNLRSAWCTDWAYLISVTNGGTWPNAYLHGPSTRLDRTWGPFDYSVRHETGHIFGAGDQYQGSGSYATNFYGYLMATHGNGCDNNSLGYFSGAGECLPDLMSGWVPVYGYNSFISPYTAGQFGWYDSDGNGVLDVSETKPAINGASIVHVVNPTTKTVSYSGVAFDRPLLNELNSPYGNVSINRITAVQYRIGSSPWQDAMPADGVFDSVSESFQFTTPALRNGTYQLQFQAINTVGKQSPVFQKSLVITGSPIANTRPFGSLSVTPDRAKLGTTVTASGIPSRDLESGGLLQFSWKWGDGSNWTPFQSGKSKTHIYTSAGTFTVQMRVRDPGGLVHLVSRNVTVEAYDTAPIVAFTATPENRHFTPSSSYSVALSVSGSRDGETPYSQLQVQWDANDDGLWDGPWTTAKGAVVTLGSLHYPKSDWRRVRVRVRDTASSPNITEAVRFIWVVPYNHRPSVAAIGVTFTPSGANYLATVNAMDADPATWDGVLEYRYDFDSDGTWDTKFGPNPTTTVTPDGRYSLSIQVQDRFHGRVSFSGWGGCNPICF